MGAVFVELLPLILGPVLAPLYVIIVLLMIASPRGSAKAAMFVLGMTLTRLVQGLVFGIILSASPDAKAENSGQSPVVSTLLLVIGLLLLITAVRKWRKEEDPDEPAPKWMQSLEQTTPLKALRLGALIMAIDPKLLVFTLSALAVISAAELGRAAASAVYLTYILLAQIVLILAVTVAALAPQAAGATLQRATDWLTRYNRPITITVSLIFGFYFTWDGITGLLR